MTYSLLTVRSRRPAAWLGALALLGATTACNDTTATGTPAAILQVINAAPRYATGVNVSVNGVLETYAQGYGPSAAALTYVAGGAFAQTVAVTAYGDTTLLAGQQTTFGVDTVYTVVFTQRPVNGGLIILPDTVSAPPAGDASFRLVNAAPSAAPTTSGTVDVYETNGTADLTGLTPVAQNVAYEGVSSYIPFVAGTGRIIVTAAGDPSTLVFDMGAVDFTAGQVWTIILLDAQGGGTPLQYAALPDRS